MKTNNMFNLQSQLVGSNIFPVDDHRPTQSYESLHPEYSDVTAQRSVKTGHLVNHLVHDKRKKTYFTEAQRSRSSNNNKRCQLPNMGSQFKDGNKLKKLSNMQMHKRRCQMALFVKESRHDREKRSVMRDAAVGSLMKTNWIWKLSEPYVATHHSGFAYIWRKPGLTFFDQILSQLTMNYSTYLLRTEYIKRKFLDIERGRKTSELLRFSSMATAP